MFNIGDRVEILTSILMPSHRPRKSKKLYGRIISRNGYCHYVRPSWCRWEAELYSNEMRKA